MDLEVYQMVEKAFEPVLEWLKENEPINANRDIKRHLAYMSPQLKANSILMRLDSELYAENLDDAPENINEHVARLLNTQMVGDFADILENGDTSSDDPSLKSFDGVLKRKQFPLQFTIDFVQAFRYYAPKKNSYEYTLFALVTTEWPGVTDDTEF